MNKLLQKCQNILLIILAISTVVSVIFVLGSEFEGGEWLACWLIINVVSFILLLYTYDNRIIYRRAIPLLMCIASGLYVIFKPVLKLHKPTYNIFRKCYKIRKMSGSFTYCYLDIQEVYDEYSGYNQEETC